MSKFDAFLAVVDRVLDAKGEDSFGEKVIDTAVEGMKSGILDLNALSGGKITEPNQTRIIKAAEIFKKGLAKHKAGGTSKEEGNAIRYMGEDE